MYVTYDTQVAEKSLLQTLIQLHEAKWCHLDVSSGNVMLQWHNDHPWDTLRLVDFGFAKEFETGTICCGHNCLKKQGHLRTHTTAAEQTALGLQDSFAIDISALRLQCLW